MKPTDEFSRETPGAGIAIKRATPDVPTDGRFHLLQNGQIVRSFRSLNAALDAYRQEIAASGWTPSPPERAKIDVAAMNADRLLGSAEEFWSQSSAHRRRGGKGR